MVLDFGLEILAERVAETKFPWLMSNVFDNETGRPLGDGKITHVIDWNGKRIGLVIYFLFYIPMRIIQSNALSIFCVIRISVVCAILHIN